MSETYDVDMFDPAPDPDLICCICQCVLNGPVESPCRHVYCRRCIERWLGSNENCPTCREVLYISELKPVLPILQNMINRLTRKCQFMTSGCEEKITVERYESHVKICNFEPFSCRFSKCGQKVLRKDLKVHEEETCLFRELKCTRDCELMILFSEIDSHDCLQALKKRLKEVEAESSKLVDQVTKMLDNQENLMKELNKLRTQSERRRLRRHGTLFSDFSLSTDSFSSETDTDSTSSTESEILSPPQSPENLEGNPTTRTRERDADPSASRNNVSRAAGTEPELDVVTVDVDSEISFNLRGRNVRLPSSSTDSERENRTTEVDVAVDAMPLSTHTSQTSRGRNRTFTEERVVRRYSPEDPARRNMDFLPSEGTIDQKLVSPVIHTPTTRMHHSCDDDHSTSVNGQEQNRSVPCTSGSVSFQDNPNTVENRNQNTKSTATSCEQGLPERSESQERDGSEGEFDCNNPRSTDTVYHRDSSLNVSQPYSPSRSSSDRSYRSEDRGRRSSRSMSQSSSHSCASGYSKGQFNRQTNYDSSSSKSPSRNWSDLESLSSSYSRRHTRLSSKSPSASSPISKGYDYKSRSRSRSYSRERSRSLSSDYCKSPFRKMDSSPYSSSSSNIPTARFSRSRSRSQSSSRERSSSSSSTDSSKSRDRSGSRSKRKKTCFSKGRLAIMQKDKSRRGNGRHSSSASNDSDITSSSEDETSPERKVSAKFSLYSHSSDRSEAEYDSSSFPMKRSRRASSSSMSDNSFSSVTSGLTPMPGDSNVNSKSWASPISSPDQSPTKETSSNEKTRLTKQSYFSDDSTVNSVVSLGPDTPSREHNPRNTKSSETCSSISMDNSIASDRSSAESSVNHIQEKDKQADSLSSDHNSVVLLNSTLSSSSSQSLSSSSSSSSELEHKMTEEEQFSDCTSPWEGKAESDTLCQIPSPLHSQYPNKDFKFAQSGQTSAQYTESRTFGGGEKGHKLARASHKNDTRADLKESSDKAQTKAAQSSNATNGSEVTSNPQVTVSKRFSATEVQMHPGNSLSEGHPLLPTGISAPVTLSKGTEHRKENSGQRKKRSHTAEECDPSVAKSKRTCKEKVSSGPSSHNSSRSSLWYNADSSKSNNPTVNVKIDLSLNVEPRSSIPIRKEEPVRTLAKPSTVCSSTSTVASVSTVVGQSKSKPQSGLFSRPLKEGLSRKPLPGNEMKSQHSGKSLPKNNSKTSATLGKPTDQMKRQAANSGHSASGVSEAKISNTQRSNIRKEEQSGGRLQANHPVEDTDESSDESWSPGSHSDASDITISEEIESDSSYELVVPKSTKQLLDELADTNDDSDDTWSPSSYFSPSP